MAAVVRLSGGPQRPTTRSMATQTNLTWPEGCYMLLWLNDVRYGRGCYWPLIGSCILAFK